MTTSTPTPTTLAAGDRAVTCETPIYRQGVTRPCGQVVGLRSWYDSAGTLHRACPLHYAERLHRYPESDPPMPVFLHEDPAFIDHPVDATVESEYATYWTQGTATR